MILCIDAGNTQIHFGVFKIDTMILQFRYSASETITSDQLGIFLKSMLSENDIDYGKIEHISICSVVPALDYSIRSACVKYFMIEPSFLNSTNNSKLIIKYANPLEVGADRIATSIGAYSLYGGSNLVIVDMGTATTIDLVTKEGHYLGGAIIPGIKTSAKALYSNTSKLPSVELNKPLGLGANTKENIQIGLYYGHLGSIKNIVSYLTEQSIYLDDYIIIATGGFSEIFRSEKFFNYFHPELAFIGLIESIKP